MNSRFSLTLLAAAFAGITACGAESLPKNMPSNSGAPAHNPNAEEVTGGTDSGSTDSGSTGGSTDSGSTGGSTDSGSTGGSTDSGSTGGSTDSGSTGGSTDSGSTGGSTDSGSTGGTTTSPTTSTSCTTNCDFTGLLTDKNRHPAPYLSIPGLYSTYADPVFGTPITRATKPSQISGTSRIRHTYSKQNPWNADDSYVLFETNAGHVWLYNGQTYRPIRQISGDGTVDSSNAEIQWHPTNPDLFYFLKRSSSGNFNKFARYEVSSKTMTILRDFANDGFVESRSRGEGNTDNKGRYYAMLGRRTDGGMSAFVYDIANNRITGKADVTSLNNNYRIDWSGVSQSGKYVVLLAADTTHVYDINMNRLGSFPRGSIGHGDFCMTADGRDVFVYDGADYVAASDGDRWINMAYLDTVQGNNTGKTVAINKIGWSTTPHVSCRSTEFPGWALISNQGGGSNNFDKEVYWVKLDGSNQVRRVAHHHSDRSSGGYFAEQHATTNKYGTKVMFASNMDGRDAISSYVIDLTEYRRPLVR